LTLLRYAHKNAPMITSRTNFTNYYTPSP
jgi:hypothetical protein